MAKREEPYAEWGEIHPEHGQAVNLFDMPNVALNIFYTVNGEETGMPIGMATDGEMTAWVPESATSVRVTGPEKQNDRATKVYATLAKG